MLIYNQIFIRTVHILTQRCMCNTKMRDTLKELEDWDHDITGLILRFYSLQSRRRTPYH